MTALCLPMATGRLQSVEGVETGLALAWAQSTDGIIGTGTTMPWHVPEDLRRFRELTMGGIVIMGRVTWDSLQPRFRPLPGRINVVLSRSRGLELPGATAVDSVEAALELARGSERPAWIIGGGQVYEAFADHADRAEVTVIDTVVGTGTRAPSLDGWTAVSSDPNDGWHESVSGLRYRSASYRRA